ncbi:hypothetical protein ElyMa_004204800 [Elysia marginata]|uniref:Uncharacterized protein n=1 Tax=Elysia marginata TaxID=1093978 RepID=A0AAV4GQ10_9GAST|nr:hypothetical protein ElyMa_004204800 [Elysia marginata]
MQSHPSLRYYVLYPGSSEHSIDSEPIHSRKLVIVVDCLEGRQGVLTISDWPALVKSQCLVFGFFKYRYILSLLRLSNHVMLRIGQRQSWWSFPNCFTCVRARVQVPDPNNKAVRTTASHVYGRGSRSQTQTIRLLGQLLHMSAGEGPGPRPKH